MIPDRQFQKTWDDKIFFSFLQLSLYSSEMKREVTGYWVVWLLFPVFQAPFFADWMWSVNTRYFDDEIYEIDWK